jgi:3',5'-cyclic AMP phosphodiesterase CpdA
VRVGVVAAACLASGASPHPVGAASRARVEPTFTVVTLPDTQYYAARHPEILQAQADWIAREHLRRGLAFVVHEGDIVDRDVPAQWRAAASSLHRLDGVIPYVLAPGNHDYTRSGDHITRHTLLDAFFPESTFRGTTCPEGTFEPGRIENSCRLIDTPAGPWVVLSLEFGPRDAVLAWADALAKKYAFLPVIVVTHAYLASDDTRYDHLTRRDQPWNPHRYLRETPGGVNDGEEMWRKLIVGNDNILFVLCGHDLVDGVGRLTSVRPDGTKVHQLLANYQTAALGGQGYLRLMEFAPERRRVRVRTYSPYLDRFKTDPANDFTLTY